LLFSRYSSKAELEPILALILDHIRSTVDQLGYSLFL